MSTEMFYGHIPEYTVGRRLRAAREDTGLSQSEFADSTGISRRTISRYESATSMNEVKRPILMAWAMATGVPMIWLETGERPDPENPGPGLPFVAGAGFEPATSGLVAA